VQLEAVKLLGDRIGMVADHSRKAASTDVVKIIRQLNGMLSSSVNDLVGHALSALRAVSISMLQGEEGALMETVPLVMVKVKARQNTGAAVAALVPLRCVCVSSKDFVSKDLVLTFAQRKAWSTYYTVLPRRRHGGGRPCARSRRRGYRFIFSSTRTHAEFSPSP
jgi:hypothetical protein